MAEALPANWSAAIVAAIIIMRNFGNYLQCSAFATGISLHRSEETMMKLPGLTIAAGLVGFVVSAQSAMAEPNTKIGALRCNVSAGLGLIITSSKEMSCVFTSTAGRHERYYGTIRKFGIDIGATNSGVLAWDVIATGGGPRRGALVGDYVGADASATVGAGVGANALVGGFGRSLSLQPISVEVQSGLALAAGVASLTLRQGG